MKRRFLFSLIPLPFFARGAAPSHPLVDLVADLPPVGAWSFRRMNLPGEWAKLGVGTLVGLEAEIDGHRFYNDIFLTDDARHLLGECIQDLVSKAEAVKARPRQQRGPA